MVSDGGRFVLQSVRMESLEMHTMFNLDWGSGYTCICQKSSNCVLINRCILLHVHYISIKFLKTLIDRIMFSPAVWRLELK